MDEVNVSGSLENDITCSADSSLEIVETTLAENDNIIISCSSESDSDNHNETTELLLRNCIKLPVVCEKDVNKLAENDNIIISCFSESDSDNHNETTELLLRNCIKFPVLCEKDDSCDGTPQQITKCVATDENQHLDYNSCWKIALDESSVEKSNFPVVINECETLGSSSFDSNCEVISHSQYKNKTDISCIEEVNKNNSKLSFDSEERKLSVENKNSTLICQDIPDPMNAYNSIKHPVLLKEDDNHEIEEKSNFSVIINEYETFGGSSFDANCAVISKNAQYQQCSTSDIRHKTVEAEELLAEIERLKFEIKELDNEIKNKKLTLKSIDINCLPDKGLKLKVAVARDERNLSTLNEQLQRVNDKLNFLFNKNERVQNRQDELTDRISSLPSANLQDLGRKALQTYRVQQSLTVDSLRKLHSSLSTCPSEKTEVSDPLNLKVPLMSHQKQALAWLLWREKEVPSGGILADDMGLGKTLTMLSLIVKQNEANLDNDSESSDGDNDSDCNKNVKYYKGGTLIVCPASIIGQWEFEVNSKIKSNFINCQTFHGTNREKKARRLAKHDIIITTYTIVRVEAERCEKNLGVGGSLEDSPLYSIKWKRIILDEAHIIRNHRSKTAASVFKLKCKHRWALTGTPIHNKTEDFFSFIKFLRCKPFNDYEVWKKWVEAKEESGMMRLNMLTKSLMLRRTKDVLNTEGRLGNLPEKVSQNITVQLSDSEYALYEEVSNFSKNLLCQLLYQKAEKENLSLENVTLKPSNIKKINPEENPFSGHPALEGLYNKVARMGNVQTHEILVLLLRLRQICCHPALMKSMIEKEALAEDGIQDNLEENLIEKMSSLSINNIETVDETSKVWDLKNPVFNPNLKSAKVEAIIDLLENDLLKTDDKIVIVSQWTSMLDILYGFLKKSGNCKCDLLTGKIPVPHRMQIVNDFNTESSRLKVLLLSLTAGGVGLNLIGGNRLILTDVHWNPQLEAQACDRVYRLGQKKPVKIYKFICSGTIEERIELIQKQKLELAENVLSSAKRVKSSHLTLKDLMTLFNVNDPQQNNVYM